jgi:hypothetical protein
MKQLIVIFEFKDSNFSRLATFKDMLRKYNGYAFISSGACIVWTNDTASIVRDNLKNLIGSGDKLFVGEVSAPAAWVTSVAQEVTDYLKKHLK